MAEVYRAHDRRLNRDVAVKILSPALADDETFVERFRREALAAGQLSHPNAVAVHDWGEADSRPFLVMEYVPGGHLKDLVRRRGALPEDEALALGGQVAAALGAAHERGLVHCDVKPHNVLLDARGRAKVADFGIAR